MNDFKLRGKCFRCKKNKFFIRKRDVKLPLGGLVAKSRELFCTPCHKILQANLEQQ